MNFLYPGFLFALISVAIPVIIHFFNFRKFKKVYFSNVQLLSEVEQQQSSRNQLKNILLLITRILAVVFLVLAFAQPYFSKQDQKIKSLENVISIYIDNSYSMETLNKDGTLLEEAKRKAKDLVANFGVNDRFQLLTNDFEGQHQRLLSANEFLQQLEDLKISASTRKLQSLIDRQYNLFTPSANQFSILISDFQKNSIDEKPLQLQKEVQYALIQVKASQLANIAVDSLYFLSPNHQPDGREQLVVKLKNYSDTDASGVPLKLSINNQAKGLANINIAAGKTRLDTLSFSGLKAGWQKGMVSINSYPITFDDSLAFSFKVNQQSSILSIDGAAANASIKSLFGNDSFFELNTQNEQNINYNNFSNYKLIILNELDQPSSGLAQQLKTYLQAGGVVLIFPNLNAPISNYNAFLQQLNLPTIVSLQTENTKVDYVDLNHPLFKSVFEEMPKKIDLPSVNRYFTFNESSKANKESILNLPGRKMFFAKYIAGEGQIYLSATGLSEMDGEFAKHPIFVPLIYQLAIQTHHNENLYANIGAENVINSAKINLSRNQSLKLTHHQMEIIPEVRQLAGKTQLYMADQIKQPGFYDLKLSDSLLAVYSFNVSRAESDMHYLSNGDLQKMADQQNFKVYDAEKDSLKLIAANHKIGQTLWKLCLILCLIFIAIEIFLIRYYNNPRKIV